jgi:hypothetical protein
MYLMESMIDMGLKEGQEWPSDAHRVVASRLALGNRLVHTRDALNDVVQKVIAIPADKIETVTIADLPAYGLGLCVSP